MQSTASMTTLNGRGFGLHGFFVALDLLHNERDVPPPSGDVGGEQSLACQKGFCVSDHTTPGHCMTDCPLIECQL